MPIGDKVIKKHVLPLPIPVELPERIEEDEEGIYVPNWPQPAEVPEEVEV